jgi:hypothetical protein
VGTQHTNKCKDYRQPGLVSDILCGNCPGHEICLVFYYTHLGANLMSRDYSDDLAWEAKRKDDERNGCIVAFFVAFVITVAFFLFG